MQRINLTSLLLLLFATATLKTHAHDYQTVYSKRTALFKNTANDQIKGLRVDSMKTVAADTILYPFTTIQEVSAGCYSPYKASWIGEKVVIKPDGANLFFNRVGNAITLKTRARLNETWIAFQRADTFRVEAIVQAIELGNALGLSDSVKTIAFRALGKQGNAVDHALNKLKVKISKRYGFVETLNFYLFPDIVTSYPNDMLSNYTLAGLTTPKLGLQNLRWFNVYDFSPGDELHIQEHNIGDPYFYLQVREYDNRCISKYLERTNYADSIVYRYARKQSIKIVYRDSSTLVTYNDTVRSVVRANPGFDQLPGEPIIENKITSQTYMLNAEPTTKIDLGVFGSYYQSGNCWQIPSGEGCLYEKRYMAKLGGPYYTCKGYIGDTQERKLVYYKKGATEWGEKLVITSSPSLQTSDQLKVFPNPASDVVTFQLSHDARTHELRIYNQIGQLLKTECFEGPSFKLHLKGIKSGVYFYKVTTSGEMIYSGKLVVE